MNILVTGGFGFIGQHTVERLLSLDYTVRLADIAGANTRCGDTLVGDIRDSKFCRECCRGIDVIVHHAAVASIPQTIKNPLEAIEINVGGTRNILEAAVEEGVKRIVFSSSAKIYGNVQTYPSTEQILPDPETPYAVTKMAAEELCRHYHQTYGIEIVCLRFFSVYGPRQSLESGYIGPIVDSIFTGRPPILYGNELIERDFTFVDDAVSATVQALRVPGIGCEIINVGSGRACSIGEVLAIVRRLAHADIHPEFRPLLPGIARKTVADTSKARDMLDFTCTGGMEEGLKRTIEWRRQNGRESAHAADAAACRVRSRKVPVSAIILTGGSGSRFSGGGLPKQFTDLKGHPVFIHAVQTYLALPQCDAVYLVINKAYAELYEQILAQYRLTDKIMCVPGGATRLESVIAAMDAIRTSGMVVLQNGASAVTPPELIKECISRALRYQAVTAYIPAFFTAFEMHEDRLVKVFNRNTMGYTCDPQVFSVSILKKALEHARRLSLEEAPTVELVNAIGQPVFCVEAGRENIKITTPIDLKMTDILLTQKGVLQWVSE